MINQFEIDGHSYIRVVCTGCGHEANVPVYCGNRFCNVCSIRRLKRVKNRLKFLINHQPHVTGTLLKHLTLTIRNNKDLDTMVKRLVSSFRRLRNRAYWKNCVIGGAFVIEVTNKGNGWHAHIHAIIQAFRIDWHKLRDLWVKCSRGSTGVYIQNIKPDAAVNYLTKYLTKEDVSLEHQRVASNALKGSRLFSPFGKWYSINCQYKEIPHPCPQCKKTSRYMPWDIVYSGLDGFLFRNAVDTG